MASTLNKYAQNVASQRGEYEDFLYLINWLDGKIVSGVVSLAQSIQNSLRVIAELLYDTQIMPDFSADALFDWSEVSPILIKFNNDDHIF